MIVFGTFINPLFTRINWPEPRRAESGCKLESGCDDAQVAESGLQDSSAGRGESLESLLAAGIKQ